MVKSEEEPKHLQQGIQDPGARAGQEIRCTTEGLEQRTRSLTQEHPTGKAHEDFRSNWNSADLAVAEKLEIVRATLDSIMDAILVTDPKEKVTDFNQKYAELWKIPRELPERETLLALHEFESQNFTDPERFVARLAEIVESGQESFDLLELKDGRIFERYSKVLAGPGKDAGRVWSYRDVTDRCLAEIAARQLAAIVASSADAIISKDLNSVITSWNAGAEHIFGYKAEEMIGTSIMRLIPWDRQEEEQEILSYIRRGERFGHFETIRLAKDGRQLNVSITVSPIKNPSGHVMGASKVARDITERKKAEQRERELLAEAATANAKFRAFFEQGPLFAGIMALDGSILEANRLSLEACGYTKEQVVGKPFWECPWWCHSAVLMQQIRLAVAQAAAGQIYQAEMPYLVADGDERMVNLVVLPIKDETGRTVFLAPTGTDITDLKRAESQRDHLLQAERAARAAAERESLLKDEFLATLSHELRTPLNGILGWSHIMRQSNAGPEVIAHGLEVIERSARAQSEIIEDLLDMSRIISGKVRLDVQRLDLSTIVQAAVETARPAAEAKGIRLQTIIDPLNGLAVSGDVNRLQQVLWNLLSNAVKFTPKGGQVQVLLERIHSHLEISVIDTGEGIKPEFLPFVFDRFRQADASTTRRHSGLGLGLSIVKQLVELHGGSVRVESNGPAQGSTFIIALPFTVSHGYPAPKCERRHPRLAPEPGDTTGVDFDVKGVRVLVIDDEPDSRTLVKRLLEGCQALVTDAGSAVEGVVLLQSGKFDVLVCDIGMPGEDGYSLIQRVRSLDVAHGGDIPAIALTAYARLDDRIKAIGAGFQMHIAKPIEPAELIAMVAAAAGRTGGWKT